MHVNINHSADTPWVGQLPEQNACWLATFAMMEHWFYCTTPTTSAASRNALRKELKDEDNIEISADIQEGELRRVAQALGMQVAKPGNAKSLAQKMALSPVAIFGKYVDWDAGGLIRKHVTLVYKMEGNTANRTKLFVTGWDPWTAGATPYTYDWDTFAPGVCSKQDFWVYYQTWS